jgi:hypothetical protein
MTSQLVSDWLDGLAAHDADALGQCFPDDFWTPWPPSDEECALIAAAAEASDRPCPGDFATTPAEPTACRETDDCA